MHILSTHESLKKKKTATSFKKSTGDIQVITSKMQQHTKKKKKKMQNTTKTAQNQHYNLYPNQPGFLKWHVFPRRVEEMTGNQEKK